MRRLFILMLLALVTACSPAKPKAEYVLTFASPYPPGHPFSKADISWMKEIEAKSKGRISFRPYWGGSLISSDMSMTEIKHGLADIGLITPIYTRGGAHMLRKQAAFYGGVKSIEQQVMVYNCLADHFPEFGNELKGLHVLAAQGGNFPGILTRTKPVRSLADLKGMRIRAQTDAIDTLRELGADPVNMPMSEVYSALAKGVVDGVAAPADAMKSVHLAEVAKHFTTLRFSRGAYPARAMSDIAWRRLPPDLQHLLIASKSDWEAALGREIFKGEQKGLDFAREHKVEVIAFPAAEQAQLDQIYNRSALAQAKELEDVGIKGLPAFAEAQRLIASGAKACPTTQGTH